MYPHPQDAYQFANERQLSIRTWIKNDHLARVTSGDDANGQPTNFLGWLKALPRLRKVKVQVSFVVQPLQTEPEC